MGTRSSVGMFTNEDNTEFRAVYVHWDGYPTGLGKNLWDNYQHHFKDNLGAMVEMILSERAGYSSLWSDFRLPPMWREYRYERWVGRLKTADIFTTDQFYARFLTLPDSVFEGAELVNDAGLIQIDIKTVAELGETSLMRSVTDEDPDWNKVLYWFENGPTSFTARGEKPNNEEDGDYFTSPEQYVQSWLEWTYLFDVESHNMHVYTVSPTGIDIEAPVCVVDLDDEEPNWNIVESRGAVLA